MNGKDDRAGTRAHSDHGDLFAGGTAFSTPAVDTVPEDAVEGSYTYSMMKAGPDVSSEEVETGDLAVEVMVLWGQTILHVAHLTPPRSFFVGEGAGRCDYFLPEERLGVSRAPLVVAANGATSVVLLPKASGSIEVGGESMSLQDAVASGKTTPCAELAGAQQMVLAVGTRARLVLDNGLTFEVSAVRAGRKVAGHVAIAAAPLAFMGLSGALHAGLLTAMFLFMPGLSTTDESDLSDSQDYMLSLVTRAEADRQKEELEQPVEQKVATDDRRAQETGTASKGESGKMGSSVSTDSNKRYAVKGAPNYDDPHIARQAAIDEARDFGMIGLLNAGAGGDPKAPTAPWGRDDSFGRDDQSARGDMWSDEIGDAYGVGFGLSGVGEGGGGRGEGIGNGNIGTIGQLNGAGMTGGFSSSGGTGLLGGTHRSKPPRMSMDGSKVSGRLPPEVIQRVVRQNFGRFRLCYENGLRTSPNLQGTVAVSFVINREGGVSSVSGGGSLPDAAVVACVTKAFYGLSFPQPDGGVVRVTYPIAFSPSN